MLKAVVAECVSLGLLPFSLKPDRFAIVLAKAEKIAKLDGIDLDTASRKLAGESFRLYELERRKRPQYRIQFALEDWQPGSAEGPKQDVTKGFLRSLPASAYRKWAPGENDKYLDDLFSDAESKQAGAL